jgi:hypothetical protein
MAKAVPLPEGARRFRGGIGQKQCTRGKGARPAAAARMPRPCERGSGVAPGAEGKRSSSKLSSCGEGGWERAARTDSWARMTRAEEGPDPDESTRACMPGPVGAAALRARPPRAFVCAVLARKEAGGPREGARARIPELEPCRPREGRARRAGSKSDRACMGGSGLLARALANQPSAVPGR